MDPRALLPTATDRPERHHGREAEDNGDEALAKAFNCRLSMDEHEEIAETPDATCTGATYGFTHRLINPFDPPADTTGAAPSPTKSDITMEDVSGDRKWPIVNAPALPQPPRYSGSSMTERWAFIRAYETYFASLSVFETQLNRPLVMPVHVCIEHETKKLIALWHFERGPNDVSEAEWIEYFQLAKSPGFENYGVVDLGMKKLAMDVRLPEAESCVNRLQRDMGRILEEYNLSVVMFAHEQKRLVKYMIAALAPATFKIEVEHRIDQAQNKHYKSNVVRFCKWMTELLQGFMVWERAINREEPKPRTKQPEKPFGTSGSGSASSASATSGGLKGTAAAKGSTSKKNPRGGGRQRDGPGPDAPRQKYPCLKCGSMEHRVRDCPQVQPGDAAELAIKWRSEKEAKKTPPPPRYSPKSAEGAPLLGKA